MLALLTYFLKKESEADEITMLSVLCSQLTFEQMFRFYENQQGGHVIEGDLYSIMLISQLQPLRNGVRSVF